ncbi:centractin- actin- protein of the dynactin complex [Spiromyces aspiralis]|uniref:Centractin- actin- protein of the dynactin complex n=1 Tax=Spiromyces aspiralis TaxID=68401 RepID=A0ACC1HWM3_9FUNG|nr:centractin- actin- protein of the dynactin complex [Spiromyces aspiralis]
MCYIALDPAKEEKDLGAGGFKAASSEGFKLPDGRVIRLGTERFRAPEILFSPEIVGLEYPGVHQIVTDAVERVDLDLRRNLYANIVLSGGSTLTKGFGDRLLAELRKTAVRDSKLKIYAPPERKYSTWIGGSILASLSTFKKMWISADEYQEDPDIIFKKVF